MVDEAGRWWTDEYTAVSDPIEADTDFCFDTCTEAREHGQPWAVVEHPGAYKSGPVSPGHFVVAGNRDEALYYLASETPIREEDRGIWFRFS